MTQHSSTKKPDVTKHYDKHLSTQNLMTHYDTFIHTKPDVTKLRHNIYPHKT